MKKSVLLTQLALAGIAAGLVSTAPLHAAEKDSAAAKKTVIAKSKHDCGGKGGCPSAKEPAHDSVKAAKVVDTLKATPAKHGCRGKNACKGLGGCSMSDKDIKAAAKKQGTAVDKAGKAHSCRGKNECKGLGGCNM